MYTVTNIGVGLALCTTQVKRVNTQVSQVYDADHWQPVLAVLYAACSCLSSIDPCQRK